MEIVSGIWYTHFKNFGCLHWFLRCKEHACPSSPHFWRRRMMEVHDWGLAAWTWFGYGQWSLIYPYSEFWLSILIMKVQEHLCPLHPDLGLWWGLDVADWSLVSLSLFQYGHFSGIHPYSKFWLSILILKIQRLSMSFKSWFGALEDVEVPDWGLASWSWFGYGYWSLIHP